MKLTLGLLRVLIDWYATGAVLLLEARVFETHPAFYFTQRWTVCIWCCYCIAAICGLEKGLDFRMSKSESSKNGLESGLEYCKSGVNVLM